MEDFTVVYVLLLALSFGLVGFLDDFFKLKYKRNLGLTSAQKAMLQAAVSAIYLYLLYKQGTLTTNLYIPFARPLNGLFEQIKLFRGISAMYYGWEPLRDIASPGALKFSTYINAYMKESSDTVLTDEAIRVIGENKPDFAFLYMVETDEKGGHDNGWMSEDDIRESCQDLLKTEYGQYLMRMIEQ